MSGVDEQLDELVHRADLDELVRFIDALTAGRDWPRLLRTRDRCRAAVATGRQLWPAATLAEYRLALWGDDEHCARVLDDDTSGRFTIGPLTEVAAQQHTLAGLRAAGLTGPRLGYLAHERALRGEAVDPDVFDPLEMPFGRQPWEPTYALATYSDDGFDAPSPPVPRELQVTTRPHVERGPEVRVADPELDLAVRELLAPWTQSSNGRVEVIGVEGDLTDALAVLGVARARTAALTPADALAWLAWAGASGGAHGRRRGAAAGRFGAWWFVAALAGLTSEWPVDPDELGEIVDELEWWWWDAGEPVGGWQLRLAAHDPHTGETWVISAHDAH